MGKSTATPEQIEFVKQNYLLISGKDMDKKFGVSVGVSGRIIKKLGLKVPKEAINKFKTEKRIGKTSFSKEETKFIEENYMTMPIKQIGKTLNRSYSGVVSRMNQLGLKVPKELAEKRKKDGMFRKGQVPINKGKKQSEYMSAEAIERTKSSRFTKGQLPPNTLPEGTEVIRRNRNKGDYYMIKVPGKTSLIYKHIWLWEQQNGKVPKGYNVVFINGNSLDCRIENLECISNEDLMKRNSLHNYPEEIKELVYIKGAITKQINKQKKKNQ
jgi:hypothetical protein